MVRDHVRVGVIEEKRKTIRKLQDAVMEKDKENKMDREIRNEMCRKEWEKNVAL